MVKNDSNLLSTKKRRKNPLGLIYIVVGALVIVALIFLLIRNLTSKKIYKIDLTKRQLIIGKSNMFAVYEDKLALVIPFNVNANKEETFGDIIKRKDKNEVLNAVNIILPEKLSEVSIMEKDIEIGTKNKKNIPETDIDGKKYVITSSLHNLFDELYNEKEVISKSNENIIVDVLNANGKGGYARKTGDKIKENLSMKVNPANYETFSDESFIILNDISKEKAQDIVMEVNEKYFKIKDASTVPTLANIVIILGKEEKVTFDINIVGKSDGATEAVTELKKQGYKNIKHTKNDTTSENSVIEYNPEDYYIAYKIGRYIGVKDMIEKDDLKNKINVIVK
ncbi:LytR C-terminal domain-containing protein [Fusobacterium sp. PH5-44]|uniref:LytR C-terminal domain-containing protein n=1 Tax=unclassified Fusobacterium TaxID=2648384 RepID=UPI003D202B1C